MEQETPQNQEALQGQDNEGLGADEKRDVLELEYEGRRIVIVGTAHVSSQSALLVKKVIAIEKPDTVCVELCASRMATITDPQAWRNMDMVQVIKQKRAYLLLSHLLLSSFQRRIADKLGVQAGAELFAAVEAAKEVDAFVQASDREIRVTLARAWRLMGFWAKVKLLFQFLGAVAESSELTEEDVEALKKKDVLELMLDELGQAMPALRSVLIDERDRFLAEKIRTAPGKKIVAVVGAGHVPGIMRYWGQPQNIAALEVLPPRSKILPVLKWGLPLLVVLLVTSGFVWAGKEAGTQMLVWWVGLNALMAGLGATAALAHPLTILSAVIAAPLTSANPTIAAGWVAGLCEAWLRKPQVCDMEAIPRDISSFKGFWRNKITRILLVVVLTNLGSAIGTFGALPLMIRLLPT
jgi:pheromone shutdown-related protein TraB